jgi:hypothetical protein
MYRPTTPLSSRHTATEVSTCCGGSRFMIAVMMVGMSRMRKNAKKGTRMHRRKRCPAFSKNSVGSSGGRLRSSVLSHFSPWGRMLFATGAASISSARERSRAASTRVIVSGRPATRVEVSAKTRGPIVIPSSATTRMVAEKIAPTATLRRMARASVQPMRGLSRYASIMARNTGRSSPRASHTRTAMPVIEMIQKGFIPGRWPPGWPADRSPRRRSAARRRRGAGRGSA